MQKGNMHNSRYINNSFIKKEVTMFLNNAPKKLLKSDNRLNIHNS